MKMYGLSHSYWNEMLATADAFGKKTKKKQYKYIRNYIPLACIIYSFNVSVVNFTVIKSVNLTKTSGAVFICN